MVRVSKFSPKSVGIELVDGAMLSLGLKLGMEELDGTKDGELDGELLSLGLNDGWKDDEGLLLGLKELEGAADGKQSGRAGHGGGGGHEADGPADGGVLDGFEDGCLEGLPLKVGSREGCNDGLAESVGNSLGSVLGTEELDGFKDGCVEGLPLKVGSREGCNDGLAESVGNSLGSVVGTKELDGFEDGDRKQSGQGGHAVGTSVSLLVDFACTWSFGAFVLLFWRMTLTLARVAANAFLVLINSLLTMVIVLDNLARSPITPKTIPTMRRIKWMPFVAQKRLIFEKKQFWVVSTGSCGCWKCV